MGAAASGFGFANPTSGNTGDPGTSVFAFASVMGAASSNVDASNPASGNTGYPGTSGASGLANLSAGLMLCL
jgi:hypothetical protein